MFLTYISILIMLYILISSLIELCQIIIYGHLPGKSELTKAFQRLEGNKKKPAYGSGHTHNRSRPERTFILITTVLVCVILFAFAMLIMRSVFFSALIGALGLLLPKVMAKRKESKLQDKLLMQFREAILSIASSLKAGASLQVALQRCEEDLKRELQLQKDTPMLEAIQKMNRDIQLGKPVEEVLKDFRDERDSEDIRQFVDATLMTRLRGGNLADVIDNTTQVISDKIMIQQEMKLATAQKKMEAAILTFLPVVLVLAILVMNPNYMQPMYDSIWGNLLLFIAVLMLVANYFIGRKVTNINI